MAAQIDQNPITSDTHYQLVSAPKPKPSDQEIKQILNLYYSELAEGFDQYNRNVSFGSYLTAINQIIAQELSKKGNIKNLLSIGAGTGHREIEIRKSSKIDFQIICIDISPKMCDIASSKGLDTICGLLPEVKIAANSFDACIFLNAFEVLTSYSERLNYLNCISRILKPDGLLFVDAMDLDNKNDAWAALVREQFYRENMQEAGYDLGDCFCRRIDQQLIVFAHYSNHDEMEKLFKESSFNKQNLLHVAEDSGLFCSSNEGNMFFIVQKNLDQKV